MYSLGLSLAVAAGFVQIWRSNGLECCNRVGYIPINTDQRIQNEDHRPGSEEIRHSSKVVTLPPEIQLPAREAYSIALKGVFSCTAVAMLLSYLIRMPAYTDLRNVLDETNPDHAEVLHQSKDAAVFRFDENYNPAFTQSLKKKDIPEGGSKGTILPSPGASPRLCFEKYVDAIIDLLIPGHSPGIKLEILFFGPDEGTADLMDWAALHARDRGATWWKSFTTGKSAANGVLADPAGINREELVRLAKLRIPVGNFDVKKLSKDGYLVKVEDQDIKLPSGEVVAEGTDFRNSAHLRFKADLFVPCGGRPESVNLSNVAALVDHDGKPHFKYVVEGANLFFSQQARLALEKRKIVLYKDSSANKGGVTCSSLDVLAGLSLDNKEFFELMTFPSGTPTEFYASYVKDIQAILAANASAEFSCIHKEHMRLRGAKPRTVISDELGVKITTT
ncbi:hypothetical protein Clacol_009707 [Clathrus columnatus]|uniref:Glutamate/phenylalanine/leucine/valine/L-tryptophan dehydrogenase C-terminal domain-containing protein n=1 Tax=Clathrus columnatus TaxID=1419009 RepID=A0AAV5AU63_9AGAM|nr:hypothetical protein Clacol_009707 [Clathrus columnatus]